MNEEFTLSEAQKIVAQLRAISNKFEKLDSYIDKTNSAQEVLKENLNATTKLNEVSQVAKLDVESVSKELTDLKNNIEILSNETLNKQTQLTLSFFKRFKSEIEAIEIAKEAKKVLEAISENQTKMFNQIENKSIKTNDKLKTDSKKLIEINSHFVNNVNATLETLSTVEKNLNWSIYEINKVKIGYIIGSLAIGLLVGFIGSTLFVSDKLLPFGYYKNNELGETLIIIEKNSPKVESTILDNGKEYLLIKTK